MKKIRPILVILVALVAFCLLFAVACKPPVIDDPDKKTPVDDVISDGLLVSNGNFANIGTSSSKKYLKTNVPGWTAVNGAKTIDSSGVVMGVIDLLQKEFDANKSDLIKNFTEYPGIAPSTKKEKDDFVDTNALVIGISKTEDAGSLYFTSGEITVKKDAYYELNIDIYTDLWKTEGADKAGASICLTDGVYSEFKSIDTSQKWASYKFYIKANGYEDRNFKIQLWLGHGPEKVGSVANPHLANGVVLFDNIELVKKEATDYESKAATINNQQVVKHENGNVETVLDLIFPDPAMTQYSPYDATSKYAGSTAYYYSAKKGVTPNYNFVVGGSELTSVDRESFPIYTTTSTDTFPIGVFDMSKFYTFEGNTPANTYSSIYTSSGGFKAPAHEDFYKKTGDKWGYAIEGNSGNSGRAADSSHDSEALLIYHPNYSISGAGFKSKKKLEIEKNVYYKLSVWVYVWIPEMVEPTPLTDAELSDPVKVSDYEKKKAEYDKYYEYYNKDRDVAATFRVTGASISQDTKLEAKSTGWGQWQQLTLKLKGNELSERQLNLEFWYGEGKWEEDTLYPGACLIDDLKIEKYTDENIDASGEDKTTFYQLSILQQGDFKEFGLIDNDPVSTNAFTDLESSNTLWEHKPEDIRTSKDYYSSGILGGQNDFINSSKPSTVAGLEGLEKGPKTISIEYNGAKVPLDVFMINHINTTASSATFEIKDDDILVNPNLDSLLKVNPNSFYRFSAWVKTAGLPSGKGATVEVSPSTGSALGSYTGINTDEWIELVLYVQGKSVDSERLKIKVTLGTGDIYNPDSHLKGAFFLTAMTWQKISYQEYKDVDTSILNVKKQAISESSTGGNTTSNITNGFFNSIESSNYDDEKLFDENGNLLGVAKPSSWNKVEAKTSLATPTVKLEDDHKKITWEAIDKATKYYIFMNKYKADGEKIADDVLVDVVDAPTKEYTVTYNGAYYVRALGGVGTQTNMFSAKSTVLTASKIVGGTLPAKYNGADKEIFEIKAGIVNYQYYSKFDKAFKDNLYGNPADGFYKSVSSNNLLLISSELDTYTGYAMSSYHSAYKDKYYMVSVWVKTIGTAKASITLKDPSSSLALKEYSDSNFAVNGGHVGFVNINTNDEWVQYRFLVNSSLTDGRITLELFLGNRYAEEISSGDGEGNIKYSQGLSRGTVLFDDINVAEIDSLEKFNLQAYGFEDLTGVDETQYLTENKTDVPYTLKGNLKYTGSYFENKYIFKIVSLKTDSFDNYTDATDDFIGHSPNAYTHRDAMDAKAYATPTGEVIPSMLYGVYNERKLTEKVNEYLQESGFSKEQISTFLTPGTNGNGSNFLMLANISESGQLYELKSGFDVESNGYYEITFSAKVLAPEGKKAQFRFIYGDDTTKWSTLNIEGAELKEYKFYVHNENAEKSISSNKIMFLLGSNDGLVNSVETKDFFKGMLIVDDVSIVKMVAGEETEQKFASLPAEQKFSFAKAQEEPKDPSDDNKDDEKKKKEVNPQLWLLITSVLIGAILLVTIIVLLVRRVGKRMNKNKKVVIQSKIPVSGPVAKKVAPKKAREESQEIDKFDD